MKLSKVPPEAKAGQPQRTKKGSGGCVKERTSERLPALRGVYVLTQHTGKFRYPVRSQLMRLATIKLANTAL